MNKLLSLIGLCKKAGKITYGFDNIEKQMKAREIDRVFLASDLSGKTMKNVAFICEKYGVEMHVCSFTMDEIDFMIHKRTGILAILDKGLSEKARLVLQQQAN